MNKVIFTDTHVFMAIVGPSGCGKTELIRQMLKGPTCFPKHEKVYYFYKTYQYIYDKMKKESNIEFVQGINFELINISNIFSTFETSHLVISPLKFVYPKVLLISLTLLTSHSEMSPLKSLFK